jgi:spermidine/putrescine transport system substrate-binding protein
MKTPKNGDKTYLNLSCFAVLFYRLFTNKERQMRKVILMLLLGLMVAVPVMAQEATMEPPAPWTCPTGFEGQTLSVYNWTTYVAEDTISNFEELCGVTVIYDTYESADALLARLRQGNPGYDVVVPSDFTIPPMVEEELLEPIDQSLIPNFANLSPELVDPPYDPGNVYTIPYQWGTVGIGYDYNKVGEEVTSWQQMFDYDGPVAWLEEKRSLIGVALKMLGFDPNSTVPEEIDAAKDFLVESGQNVTYIAGDDGQEALARGEVNMTVEYNGDIFQKIDECASDPNCTADFRYVIPEEGANLWTDVLAIPTGAQNIPLAHAFIDYILDPQVGADISNYTAFGSPNQASIDFKLIDEELLTNPGIYPSEEARANLFFIQANPDEETLYNDAWDEIKILIGG